jgi:hypothetical protein
MGYFSNLEIEILDLYEEGVEPTSIAKITGATLTNVLEVISNFENDQYEPVEPDDSYADGEALASAGFGTDEDYGYYGDEE